MVTGHGSRVTSQKTTCDQAKVLTFAFALLLLNALGFDYRQSWHYLNDRGRIKKGKRKGMISPTFFASCFLLLPFYFLLLPCLLGVSMNRKLRKLLKDNNVEYDTVSRSPDVCTAQEIAASSHLSGKEVAKVVMVKVDGKMTMAVLPAHRRLSSEELSRAAGGGAVELANEEEFGKIFADCLPGAMSPFGNLYGMEVYVERTLTENPEIAFNACSFDELVRLSYKDFAKLVKPKVAEFSYVQ
jgi:Ala-tRNA(Pro) deacylase